MAVTLKKYSVNIQGHATSITLEELFWQMLKKIADQEKRSVASIITEIDKNMSQSQKKNLSSHIRIYVLEYCLSMTGWSNANKTLI